MKKPLCSIIVLNFNGKEHLGDCFSSLNKINYPKSRHEVIMVDNASSDGSVGFVKKHFPRVKILRLDKNYGFAEGNNRGAEKAKGEYMIFLNNDTKVDENWLTELVRAATKGERIGICGSKIFDQKLNAVIGEGRLNLLGVPDIHSKHDTNKECFFVSGASMLIKRSLLKKLGYCFDPSFFAYFEDVDLCWRARLYGYKVLYAPRSTLLHKGGSTFSKYAKMARFYHYRNKIWTFKKNTKPPLTQFLLTPIFFGTVLAILYFSARGQLEHGTKILGYFFFRKERTQAVEGVSLKNQLRLFFV